MKFGHELLNTDIPGKHLQLFRDVDDGSTIPGFMLKVTLDEDDVSPSGEVVPEPTTVAFLGIGLAGTEVGRRRKKKTINS